MIRVRASSRRSADSSCVSVHPRWTPPSPPVANTRIPARAARNAVAETVVAPLAPAASGRRQVTIAQLPYGAVPGDPLQLGLVQAHMGPPVQHGHRRGHGAAGPYKLLKLFRHRQIARARQPVRDDRRFQRDDGTALRERVPYLGGQVRCGV